MTIVFVSNFINHHQKPVSDHLYELTNGNYFFIATEPIPEEFKKTGYPDYSSLCYVVKAYESEEIKSYALDLVNNADVVISSGPDFYTYDRIKNNKLTFRYAERFFKAKPFWKHPGMIKYLFFHDAIHRNENLYMLAASGFLANDMHIVGAYPNKIFKWGYFTDVPVLDIESVLSAKRCNKIRIMWCARFIGWKHPEMVPQLARKLIDNGYMNFEIEMCGSGEKEKEIKELVKYLNVGDYVSLMGNIPNNQLLEKMRDSNIFLFTSDRNEGWGAVLNEAMSSGCAVVASNEIGAVPFLLEDGVNGLVFKSKSISNLYDKLLQLFENRDLVDIYAKNAYVSMTTLWNPKIAAFRFSELSQSLLLGKRVVFDKGPCSIAKCIKTKV